MQANRFYILEDYIKQNWCSEILEIGVYKGDTARDLIKKSKNQKVNYTGIDLFEDMTPELLEQEKAIPPDSLKEVAVKLNGIRQQKVTLHKGFSKDILPQLIDDNKKYDLIFIDGGHSLKTLALDFKYSLKLLKEGGTIFIDDYSTEKSMEDVKIFCDSLKKQKHLNVQIKEDKVDFYRDFKYQIVEVKINNDLVNIDVLTSFNTDFFPMFFDIFLPSLPPKTTLYTKIIKGEVDKRFGVFYQKMEFVRDHLKNNSNLIFFLDADVVIMSNDILYELADLYEIENKPDLLMQWNQLDSDEKNIGVMLINPTERVKQLYQKYCEANQDWIIEQHGFDQKYFAHLLRTEFSDLNVKILPTKFYGKQMQGIYEVPEDIQLYHATFEPNLQEKYNTLKNYFNKRI